MKPRWLVLLVWMEAALVFGHEHNGTTSYLYTIRPVYTRTELGDAIDKTTTKMIKEAYDSSSDKNIISSPLGVMLLLSLYSAGAGEGSRQDINCFLGGAEYTRVSPLPSYIQSESYNNVSRQFAAMDPSYFTLANKIYISNDHELNETFVSVARSYKSEVDKIDFSDPTIAAKNINEWANQKTQGHIKDPVPADALAPETVAALFNVIFFQGHWHVPFKADQTKEKDFYVDKKTKVKKPFMHLLRSLYYTASEELDAKMVELPYKEAGFRMVIVLPNEVDGLPALLEKAAQRGLLEDVFKLRSSHKRVDFQMPRFEIKSKLNLNDILPKMGVSKIFLEPALGVANVPVTVSKAFQDAFVNVDEEGATAGAFTGMSVRPISDSWEPPPPLKFFVDHPFMFTILHEDMILFVGTYTH